ncbi:hypothetical protein K474DRAFT_1471936 [Panus rudis PR-1116 ss-1]|nr:hypothetical protein K474DRAFT_1471936 [Panus rudis PR-1116 ss-1]
MSRVPSTLPLAGPSNFLSPSTSFCFILVQLFWCWPVSTCVSSCGLMLTLSSLAYPHSLITLKIAIVLFISRPKGYLLTHLAARSNPQCASHSLLFSCYLPRLPCRGCPYQSSKALVSLSYRIHSHRWSIGNVIILPLTLSLALSPESPVSN